MGEEVRRHRHIRSSASIGSGTFEQHIDSGKPIVRGSMSVLVPTGQPAALCRVVSHVQKGAGILAS
jgi:hypothetical protein